MNELAFKRPGTYEINRLEKLHNIIFDDVKNASKSIALEIKELILLKQKTNENCVLGLATGSSPITVYEELIKFHRNGLSFYNVITFNLDEYDLLPPEHIQSYHSFMHDNLFDHIDIPPENIHIPSGILSPYEISDYCNEYEKKIEANGGIDLQILGIGRTGHIGFNEPGSHINSITRQVVLDHITRFDASQAFNGIENVPKKAITMGISTILKAKRIILMAWGANKAKIVSKAIEGKVSSKMPCSYLQNHINTTVVLDNDSAKELTRIKTPWRVDLCEWNEDLKFKAVLWLSDKTNKPILKLEDEDYNKYGMSDLINQENNAYDLNIKIFDRVQRMITGWPGGKPNVEQERYPERSSPSSKRCLIFSPHPDDDVISMGGTLDRLISQGHEVHVVYQTSGNIAVPDHEALKFIEVCEGLSVDIPKKIKKLKKRLKERNISPQDENLLLLKGNIRKSEACAAVRFLNLNENNIHFLDLPFYQTGKIKKNPVSEIDISLTVELINKIKPHQIFAAGDLADPHGTHKKCFEVILESLKKIKNQPYSKNCWLWLYRGAWLDWEIHEANMAIPMSPSQVLRKRSAIFFHQTQKDGVMYQGEDRREFWLRAEERNRNNAQKLKNLGMTNYEAVELYKRYLY